MEPASLDPSLSDEIIPSDGCELESFRFVAVDAANRFKSVFQSWMEHCCLALGLSLNYVA